jgi:hypothetical protein
MSDKQTMQGNKKGFSSVQNFLPISEIREGVVVLKNGGVRAVLKVSSVNFYLKSEEEQNSLIYAFQSFLNILDFPVQIMCRSKKLDIDYYLHSFETIIKNQPSQLMKNLTQDYLDYVKKLVEYADIMEKQFFIVIPYDPVRIRNRGVFSIFMENFKSKDDLSSIRQKHYEFDALKKGLMQRVENIKTGINNLGLKNELLETPELVELYYQSFHPFYSQNQKFNKNINEERLVNM